MTDIYLLELMHRYSVHGEGNEKLQVENCLKKIKVKG